MLITEIHWYQFQPHYIEGKYKCKGFLQKIINSHYSITLHKLGEISENTLNSAIFAHKGSHRFHKTFSIIYLEESILEGITMIKSE